MSKNENQYGSVAIEPSTNTHTLTNVKVKSLKRMENCTKVVVKPNESVCDHGEHGTLALEKGTEHLVVYRQQELNVISKTYQDVVD